MACPKFTPSFSQNLKLSSSGVAGQSMSSSVKRAFVLNREVVVLHSLIRGFSGKGTSTLQGAEGLIDRSARSTRARCWMTGTGGDIVPSYRIAL